MDLIPQSPVIIVKNLRIVARKKDLNYTGVFEASLKR